LAVNELTETLARSLAENRFCFSFYDRPVYPAIIKSVLSPAIGVWVTGACFYYKQISRVRLFTFDYYFVRLSFFQGVFVVASVVETRLKIY
jgi:hypothetical protein